MRHLRLQLHSFPCIRPLFIFCVLFISASVVHALDYRERLSANIVKTTSNKRRIILDRGKEDGVVVGDIARFFRPNKSFLFVGVAIFSHMEFSEWVVYRTYAREVIDENTPVNLVSLYGVKKPHIQNLAEIQSNSLLKRMQEEHEKRIQEKKIKEREKREKVLLKKYTLKKYEDFPIPELRIELNASPISFKSPNSERLFSLGSKVSNVDQTKYIFSAGIATERISYTNRFQGNHYSSSETRANSTLEFKKIWDEFNSYSLFEYRTRKEGQVYPINYQFDFGVIGAKYSFPSFFITRFKEFSIAYVPLIEFFSSDQGRTTSDAGHNESSSLTQTKESYYRHAFLVFLEILFHNNLRLVENFSWRPLHDIGGKGLDLKDNDFSNKLTLSYDLTPKITFSFVNLYTMDSRREKNFSLPSSEWTNSIHFHYQFELRDIFF